MADTKDISMHFFVSQAELNLIDVGIGAAEEIQHFSDLRHIQPNHHAVNRHLAEEGAEVRVARQRHVLENQVILFL